MRLEKLRGDDGETGRGAAGWLLGPASRVVGIAAGLVAALWFLVRVVPKPSRASYPCQRAALPLASGFALSLTGWLAARFAAVRLRRPIRSGWIAAAVAAAVAVIAFSGAATTLLTRTSEAAPSAMAARFNWTPGAANAPIGMARGINPGRVVWARDPAATKWAGRWNLDSDQWWTDANTDQAKVDALLSATLRRLTSTPSDDAAWQAIFRHYNRQARGLVDRGYRPGEIVAVKINVNNSETAAKADNKTDASPHTVMAMVRQLVEQAHIAPGNIIVYDARRFMPPAILTKVWAEYKDVRFIQDRGPQDGQPKNAAFGDFHGLEGADWVQGVTYSAGTYDKARFIPRQVLEATYLVNLALLKAHSYPYNTMENGDEGQTAVTMCGKNHFGSIQGTPELHADINTAQRGTPNAYSPIVDLAASPNLGAKTVLYVLDGLYSGRKWRSYPQHFPNPPFNNRVEPYENPDWPASLLASQDGVALDSVGLDILYSQTKNNGDPKNGNEPRILIRENADDYLVEMADPEHAPSKTAYVQDGKPVSSLGVHEHWDSDATRRYSRNLDRAHGKGIELLYLPLGEAPTAAPVATLTGGSPPTDRASLYARPVAVPASAIVKAIATTDGRVESGVSSPVVQPLALPGKGLRQHPFLYAGEWDYRKPDQTMFVVRDGKVVWTYSIPIKQPDGTLQEWGDATMLSNGNILFSRKTGAGIVTPEKKLIWNFDAPRGTEIHVAQPVGRDRVMLVQNGDPAKLMIINLATGRTERELVLPTGNPAQPHGHFRRVRMTRAGTFLAAHMDTNKVAEYDADGREIWAVAVLSPWSAVRLASGNTLISSNRGFVREVNSKGETVWEFTRQDSPDIQIFNCQEVNRLANGNTVIANWCANGLRDPKDWPASVQILEVTPQKKIVWALRSWEDPADFGPATAIQLLDEPGVPENGDLQR